MQGYWRLAAFVLMLLLTLAAAALAAPGQLDSSFDGDGVRVIDFSGLDAAADLAIRPDDRIVVTGAGSGTGGVSDDFIAARLKLDGSLDSSFSGDGMATIGLGGKERGGAAALYPDGRIVVAGDRVNPGGDSNLAIIRVTADGALDPTFGDGGRATIDFGGVDTGDDVLLQPDGKIVVAGSVFGDLAVVRLGSNGAVEGGARQARFGAAASRASAVALQADGKIVAAGFTQSTGLTDDFAVARYNADLTLDSSFDGDGRKTIDLGGDDHVSDVVIQPDRKIVLTGSGPGDVAVTRLNPDGSLDTSFDGDGSASVDLGADKGETGVAAALQANGKIVVESLGGASQVVLLRFQRGGTLDTTFDGDGKQTLPLTGGGAAVALLHDGRIVAAGTSENNVFVALVEGDSPVSGGGPAGPGGDGGGSGGGKTRVPRCAGRRATIVGTGRSERLKGTRRNDVIVALGGNDRIAAGRGNDIICAGNGNDTVSGDAGKDRVFGQNGKDRLSGGPGNDTIDGGSATDKLAGGAGKDRLVGGRGEDRCNGGAGQGPRRVRTRAC